MATPGSRYAFWPDGWPDLEPTRGNAARETDAAVERMESFIRIVARTYAPNDRILADDLKQAARIWLWDVDPSRLSARDLAYVRHHSARAIRNARRREWRTEGGRFRVQAPPVPHGLDAMAGQCVNRGIQFGERPASLREWLEWFQDVGRV